MKRPPLDLLLIDPPWFVESDDNLWREVRSCLPSLGVAYIASYAEQRGYRCAIVDCTAERLTPAGLRATLARRFPVPPRFVGVTATSVLFPKALEVARVCRELFPEARIVFGGVHPTVLPDETLSNDMVDAVVRDEGEETAVELLSGKDWAQIAGLSYREGSGVVHNPDRALIPDLDSIPPPAYHLLPMARYRPAVGSYRRLPAMSLFATRGCPGHCTFCYTGFRGKVRKRSAGSILDEIGLLQRTYGVREVAFYDDTFSAFKNEVTEFCDRIVAEKIDLTWSCFTRVDHVNERLLRKMKKAGCHLILFGVESADEGILRTIDKRVRLDQVQTAVRIAREIGISTRASFMLGNPGETVETAKKTIDYALRLDPDQVQFNITTVYPGTRMYDWAKENGYLLEGAAYTNVSDINMRLPSIAAEELLRLYREAHRRFYLRPAVVWRRIQGVRSAEQLRQEISGGLAVVRFSMGQWPRLARASSVVRSALRSSPNA